jgi:hypothetical protein
MNLAELQQHEWYRSRPEAVQRRIDAYPPIVLYRLKTTNQIVQMYSYEEDEHNPQVTQDRIVFGISFDDLEAITG